MLFSFTIFPFRALICFQKAYLPFYEANASRSRSWRRDLENARFRFRRVVVFFFQQDFFFLLLLASVGLFFPFTFARALRSCSEMLSKKIQNQ